MQAHAHVIFMCTPIVVYVFRDCRFFARCRDVAIAESG